MTFIRICLATMTVAMALVTTSARGMPLIRGESDAPQASCADPQPSATANRPNPSNRPLLFDQFVQPFVDQALQRRAHDATEDPQYGSRVNRELSMRRLNVAVLGYGEEHDQTYDDQGVSITILSLNLDSWDMASISLSRDIRAPELEDRSVQFPPRWPVTMRAAYRSTGFAGTRTMLEDVTGLPIDYMVLMKDVFVRNYIDSMSGPVELVVPKDFRTNVYRLNGIDHGEDLIPAGRQTLSTDQAMTFILGESLDPQGRADERSYRKDLLLRSLSCQVRQKFAARDVGFALRLLRFSLGELKDQNLSSDFDFQLVAGGLSNLANAFVTNRGEADATFPQLGGARELVVHDEAFGDGGVRRVHHMSAISDDHGIADNALVKEEMRIGSLAPYMLIPVGGNPYSSDLVNDYWGSVRTLVSTMLVRGNPS
jgi:hypothetical protein